LFRNKFTLKIDTTSDLIKIIKRQFLTGRARKTLRNKFTQQKVLRK